MRRYVEGDQGKALCEPCQGLVNTTFRHRDIPAPDGSGTHHGLLVAVCDACDGVALVPPQSAASRRGHAEVPITN